MYERSARKISLLLSLASLQHHPIPLQVNEFHTYEHIISLLYSRYKQKGVG
jgi:hypothetical protein